MYKKIGGMVMMTKTNDKQSKMTTTIVKIVLDRKFDVPYNFISEYVDKYIVCELLTQFSIIYDSYSKDEVLVAKEFFNSCSSVVNLKSRLILKSIKPKIAPIIKSNDNWFNKYLRYNTLDTSDVIEVLKTWRRFSDSMIPIPRSLFRYIVRLYLTNSYSYASSLPEYILKISEFDTVTLEQMFSQYVRSGMKYVDIGLTWEWYWYNGGSKFPKCGDIVDLYMYLNLVVPRATLLDDTILSILLEDSFEYDPSVDVIKEFIVQSVEMNGNNIKFIVWNMQSMKILATLHKSINGKHPAVDYNHFKKFNKFVNNDTFLRDFIKNGGLPETISDDAYVLRSAIGADTILTYSNIPSIAILLNRLYFLNAVKMIVDRLSTDCKIKLLYAAISQPGLLETVNKVISTRELLEGANIPNVAKRFPEMIPHLLKSFPFPNNKEFIKSICTMETLPMIDVYLIDPSILLEYITGNTFIHFRYYWACLPYGGFENLFRDDIQTLKDILLQHPAYIPDIKDIDIRDLLLNYIVYFN
jgi:hypothetical protein